jgi:hypothetical protein
MIIEFKDCHDCPYGSVTLERDPRFELDTGKVCEYVFCRKLNLTIHIENADKECPLK